MMTMILMKCMRFCSNCVAADMHWHTRPIARKQNLLSMSKSFEVSHSARQNQGLLIAVVTKLSGT